MKLPILAVIALIPCLASAQTSSNVSNPSASSSDSRVALAFSGGHDTFGPDRGRPVILIASALKVPPEVFRKVFSGVKPAGPGEEPQPDQVRKNKQTLLAGLGPYGVTDDRLNEVSNYYRYRRSMGEMWPVTPATGYATIRNGTVASVIVTNAGSGYSSPPTVSIAGMPNVSLTPVLAYGTDFATNGSIREIKIGGAAGSTTP